MKTKKRFSTAVAAALVLTVGMVGADTLTWTGGGDRTQWSDPLNWSSSGSHTVPQNGDSVYASATTGTTVSNDLSNLSLALLELKYVRDGSQGTSGRKYVNFTGQTVTLTGGLSALKTTSSSLGGSVESDYEIINAIPFVLTDGANAGTNKFDCTCRVTQKGALSGPGLLWLVCSGVVTTLNCENTCAGTYLTGGSIFDADNAKCLGDGSVRAVHALTGGMIRQYSSLDCWLDVQTPGAVPDSQYTFGQQYSVNFNGRITGKRMVVSPLSSGKTVTFNGDVDVEGPVHAYRQQDNYNLVFNGAVQCQDFGRYYAAKTGTVTFNHSGNAIENLYALYHVVYAGAVDALGTNAVVRFGEQSDAHGVIDCRGFDQTIDRIALNSSYPISAAKPDGHLFTSSDTPAVLTLRATADCETDAKFGGKLSLLWNPRSPATFRTYAAYGRVMPMTGTLIVSNGTFEVNGSNCFPYATAVTVADGARFDWLAEPGIFGLMGAEELRIGSGAVFSVGTGATVPFVSDASRAKLAIELAATAQLLLPDDAEIAVSALRVDGVDLPAGTVATGVPGVPGTTNLAQLAGSTVRITVTGSQPPAPVALGSAAYVKDGLVCHLDAIDNAGVGVHNGSATSWTDLTGLTGSFSIFSGVGSFTETALRKTASGCLARSETRRSDVRTIEAAMSGVNSVTSGYVMPVFMGSDQNVIFSHAGGLRKFLLDKNHFGWQTAVAPDAVTIAALYASASSASTFYQNGEMPEGESCAGDTFSDNNQPSGGTTLGGRTISWTGGDTTPYGYSIHAVRLYNRMLTASEAINNYEADQIRFHGTYPTVPSFYREAPDAAGVTQCRVTFDVLNCSILINGSPCDGTYWADVGETVQVTACPAGGRTFIAWMGDVSNISADTVSNATASVFVDRALSFQVSLDAGRFIVTSNTNLTDDVACSGIVFKGPYTVTADAGCGLMIDENAAGVGVEEGVTGTATIECPLAIAPLMTGNVQTVAVPSGATLVQRGALTGKAPLVFPGPGAYKTLGTSPYEGTVEVSNGTFTVSGRFLASESSITLRSSAILLLDAGEIGGLVKQRVVSGTKWLDTTSGTENRLCRGIDWSGVEFSIYTQAGSKLWIEQQPCNSTAAYYDPKGNGELHFTNVTYTSTMMGAFQPDSTVTVHLWSPNALRVGNHLSSYCAMYSHVTNTIAHSPLQLYNGALWDLGGYDQTCGRFSWMDSYPTCEITSEAPATLRVYQDIQSGSGSNRGTVTYLGRISGAVSLVKTGNETSTSAATTGTASDTRLAEDLIIGSAISSTGRVEVVWGLLSFTNATGRVGSWLGCGRAVAGGTVDAKDEAHAGTLELLHSTVFSKKTDVYVQDGGKVRLSAGVIQKVRDLYLDGSDVHAAYGTWGSSASTANYKDDVHFEGAGMLNVLGENQGTLLKVR